LVAKNEKGERFSKGQKGTFDSPIEAFLSVVISIDNEKTGA